MADKALVVFGATGKQGHAVLQYFLRNRDAFKALRGITRNTASPASQELQSHGVEMVQADLDDVDSLRKALHGASHVFANADSSPFIFHAAQHPEILAPGQTPATYAQEIELRYGDNLRRALLDTASVERIIWSSLPSPKKWSAGRWTNATMFDVKEQIADALLEDPKLAGKVSVLYLGFYGDNALLVPVVYAPKKQADGSYKLELPVAGSVRFAYADVEKDIGKWLLALFAAPAGQTLVGASDYYSFDEWVRAWASANNVSARYEGVSLESFAASKPGIGLPLGEMIAFVGAHGYAAGNAKVVELEALASKDADVHFTGFEDYIRSQDWSSIL